jgi:hypothetical protein
MVIAIKCTTVPIDQKVPFIEQPEPGDGREVYFHVYVSKHRGGGDHGYAKSGAGIDNVDDVAFLIETILLADGRNFDVVGVAKLSHVFKVKYGSFYQ